MGIWSVHRWYDKIDELWRFLLMLAIFSPWYVGMFLHQKYPLLYFITSLYIGIVGLWRISYHVFYRKKTDGGA